jgi:chromosomal replication initiator protein
VEILWESCVRFAGGLKVQAETEELAVTERGSDYWKLIKSRLAAKMPPQVYHNWVLRTELETQENGSLRVRVPDEVTKEFLEQEYGDDVKRAIIELKLPIRRVEYKPGFRSIADVQTEAYAPEPGFAPAVNQLNPKFRFNDFVVGSCNQFAHAAALAVSKFPARSYNPLFIYGCTGMGKTHLLQAVGWALSEEFHAMRVVYATAERFMNDMVACLRSNRMPAFHRHYRSTDVLLLDDIHILGGKSGTQEEFFHTFNELHEHQKQIVISSDSPPKDINGLVDRLRSRFEWGLMVDVQPPDLETKMAILDKKAEIEGVALPEDVRIYIATKTKSNVRELEGALVKLVAYSSVTGSSITLTMAQQVLKYLIPGGERRVTMEMVLKAVAEQFSLQPAQLKQKSNTRAIAFPRQLAMYLIKELTQASLPEIGRLFGKHHATVIHSIRKIEALRQKDNDLNSLIHKINYSIL